MSRDQPQPSGPPPQSGGQPAAAPEPSAGPVPRSLDEVPEETALEAVPLVQPDVEVKANPKRNELLLRRTFPRQEGFWHKVLYWLGHQPQIRTRLDPGGAFFWKQVDGRRTLGQIAQVLAQRFNVPEDRAREAALHFARSLMLRRFLLLWMPGDPPPPEAASSEAAPPEAAPPEAAPPESAPPESAPSEAAPPEETSLEGAPPSPAPEGATAEGGAAPAGAEARAKGGQDPAGGDDAATGGPAEPQEGGAAKADGPSTAGKRLSATDDATGGPGAAEDKRSPASRS